MPPKKLQPHLFASRSQWIHISEYFLQIEMSRREPSPRRPSNVMAAEEKKAKLNNVYRMSKYGWDLWASCYGSICRAGVSNSDLTLICKSLHFYENWQRFMISYTQQLYLTVIMYIFSGKYFTEISKSNNRIVSVEHCWCTESYRWYQDFHILSIECVVTASVLQKDSEWWRRQNSSSGSDCCQNNAGNS